MSGTTVPYSVSVMVPTLNAMGFLPDLLKALKSQQPYAPREILIVDSGSSDGTAEYVADLGDGVRLITIDRFSHGGARNLEIHHARGEYVVFLSQDAAPRDNAWLAELIAPFSDPNVAAVFSRQVPREGANPMEQFFLATHFPANGAVYQRNPQMDDLQFQRDVFFSNVSSAVRRDMLERFPFDETLIMSEDQQFARDVILYGCKVVYAPASVVLHSHNYSWRQALGRYFDSAYSLTCIFERHGFTTSARIGSSYLRRECGMMIRHHPLMLPRYGAYVLAKTLGTVLGHHAERLPRWMARKISMHSNYWILQACIAGCLAWWWQGGWP